MSPVPIRQGAKPAVLGCGYQLSGGAEGWICPKCGELRSPSEDNCSFCESRGIIAEQTDIIVFLAPPWKEIYETDNERKQDFAEAERTFAQMVQVYQECGYTISELRKAKPAARANFIL